MRSLEAGVYRNKGVRAQDQRYMRINLSVGDPANDSEYTKMLEKLQNSTIIYEHLNRSILGISFLIKLFS